METGVARADANRCAPSSRSTSRRDDLLRPSVDQPAPYRAVAMAITTIRPLRWKSKMLLRRVACF